MFQLVSPVLLLALVLGVAVAADDPKAGVPDDPELKKATDEYTAAVEKARKELVEQFAAAKKRVMDDTKLKVEEKIDRAGDLEKEQAAFEADPAKLPKSAGLKAGVTAYQKKVADARGKCAKAFDAAADKLAKTNLAAAKAIVAEKTALLGKVEAEKWNPLFNGRDLTNWRPTVGSTTTWAATGGVIVGTGNGMPGAGSLVYTKTEFDNFRVRLKVMPDKGRMVMFRSVKNATSNEHDGYTVSLDPTDGEVGTLGIFVTGVGGRNLAVAEKTPTRSGTWVELEIIAKDNNYVVKVGGVEVVNHTEANKTYAKGSLGLRCGRNASIRVKSVELLQSE